MSGWGGVTVVGGHAAAPLTVDDMRARLRLDRIPDDEAANEDVDAVLTACLLAAAASIDGPAGIGVAMMRQTWRLTLDALPRAGLILPGGGVVGVASFRCYIGGEMVDIPAADYRLVLGGVARVVPADGVTWPSVTPAAGAVEIDYTLGAETPEGVAPDLVAAVGLIASHMFNNSHGDMIAEIPPGAAHILRRHRRGWIA